MPAQAPARPRPDEDSPIQDAARQVRAWSDSVLGIAGAAADVSIGAAKAILVKPEQRAALEKAGGVLRGMREAAGLSVKEVGARSTLRTRRCSTWSRTARSRCRSRSSCAWRPCSAATIRSRSSCASRDRTTRRCGRRWKGLGIGRFAVQAGREREFANIYRASDAARGFSDEEFAAVLAFTKAAFDLAMAFRAGAPANPRGAARSHPRSKAR